jgi:ligand-binding sensor domain-containing protein
LNQRGGHFPPGDKTDNVLRVSESSGWVPLNHDLGITQFYGGAGNLTSGTINGGTQDNGTLRYSPQDGTDGWTTAAGGDGGFCAVDQTDPNYSYGEYPFLEIHRSRDGGTEAENISGRYWDGKQWQCKPAPYQIPDACNATANFIAPFILDPNDQNRLLAGGQSLWRTNDAKTPNTKLTGPSWAEIKRPASGPISAIAVAQGNSDIIWVGHNNGQVYYTQNGTAALPEWSPASNGLPEGRYCTRITIDPQHSNVVYATFGGFEPGNVWKTTGFRAPWENISNRLPSAPVFSLVVSPSNSRALYVGTAVGIFASADGGTTWSRGNDGPANAFVEELFWMGTQLVAATHGRGMFIAGPPLSFRASYR